VAGYATAVDAFDQTCKEHDRAYAQASSQKQLDDADMRFYNQNVGKGPVRSAAAVGVRFFGPRKGVLASKAKKKPDTCSLKQGPSINRTNNNKQIYQAKPKQNIPTMQRRRNKPNNTLTSAPVARSKTVRIPKPVLRNSPNGVVVKHREFWRTITSNTSVSIVTTNINPGRRDIFSWLSNVAMNYEQYRFRKLSFTFVSAQATSYAGRVGMAHTSNPTSSGPKNRNDFFNVTPNVEESPWEDMVLNVPVSGKKLFVRGLSQTVGGTSNTYDEGQICLMAAMNPASADICGEVFVEYELELFSPIYPRHFGGRVDITSPTDTVPFGTAMTVANGYNPFEWNTGNALALSTGTEVLIVFRFTGTGLAYTLPTYVQYGGSVGSITNISNVVNTAGTTQTIVAYLSSPEDGDQLTVPGGESTTTTAVAIFTGPYDRFSVDA